MTSFKDTIEKFFNHEYNNDGNTRGQVAHFQQIGHSDTLLVTIGESWTWGNSLPSDRLINVWGHRLAAKLSLDWLNIARCGSSNFWIFYQLSELLRYLHNENDFPYQKIIFVFCLTETGRELNEHWSWYEYDPINFFYSQPTDISVQDLIKRQNYHCVRYAEQQIEILRTHVDCDVWIGHNFCSPIYWNIPFFRLEKSWNQITAHQIGYDLSGHPSIVQNSILEKYREHLKNNDSLLEQLINIQEQAIQMLNFFDFSPLNYKSQHPTAENNELWASYVANKIKGG
jgi:hypothetical protein